MQYNKLIRDHIPDIIRAGGKECAIRVLSDDEYLDKLVEKLSEELSEFLVEYRAQNDEKAVRELADLEEVLLAIVEAIGIPSATFQRIREAKRQQNGGFTRKLLLLEVED